MSGTRLDWDRARRREMVAPSVLPRPTAAQLAYIADLAEGLGVTIARPPETMREAGLVIEALKRRVARARRARST